MVGNELRMKMKISIKDKTLIVDGEKCTEVYLSKDEPKMILTLENGSCEVWDFKGEYGTPTNGV